MPIFFSISIPNAERFANKSRNLSVYELRSLGAREAMLLQRSATEFSIPRISSVSISASSLSAAEHLAINSSSAENFPAIFSQD